MKRSKKTYDDDDGRSIVDMRGVQRRNVFLPQSIRFEERLKKKEQPSEQELLDKKSSRYAILGATAAGLMIAGIFIVGLGLAILAMVLLWA